MDADNKMTNSQDTQNSESTENNQLTADINQNTILPVNSTSSSENISNETRSNINVKATPSVNDFSELSKFNVDKRTKPLERKKTNLILFLSIAFFVVAIVLVVIKLFIK